MISKTTIRSALGRMVSQREYCLKFCKIKSTPERRIACEVIKQELERCRLHTHNAHTALVRRNARYIEVLINSYGKENGLRTEVKAMLEELTSKAVEV